MKSYKLLTLGVAGMLTLSNNLFADEIICKNGSVFVGTITAIDGGIITMKNSADNAGETKLKQSEITSMMTSTPIFVRTQDGKTLQGKIVPAQNKSGYVSVDNAGTPLIVSMADILSSWTPDGKSPEQREAEKREYKWTYSVGASIVGTTGNTESVAGALNAEAVYQNIDNILKLYTKYNYGKTKDDNTHAWTKSADNLHAGFDFSSQFHAPIFWYARSDNGFDKVQNIKFFDTSAMGLGWNIIKEDDWNFSVRGGLAYRYESYKDYTNTLGGAELNSMNTTGLEFGLHHDRAWDWGKIVTDITYVPGFDSFTGNYYILHETYAEMNVKTVENLYFRIGVKNEYRSRTTAHKHLDTTYYAQLVFLWK